MGPVAKQPIEHRAASKRLTSLRSRVRILSVVALAGGLILGTVPAAPACQPGVWHRGAITKTPWKQDGPMRIQLDGTDYLLMPTATVTRYSRDGAGHFNAQPMDYRYLLPGQQIRFKAQGFSIYAIELER